MGGTKDASLLTESGKKAIPLYDPAALTHMEASVAQGYANLLGGASPEQPSSKDEPRKPPVIDDGAVDLGFLAIVEGNVVDACFGVHHYSKNKQGQVQVRKVKALLRDGSEASDGFERLAVETYRQAFCVVMAAQNDIKKLNFITRCFFYSGIVAKAEADLRAIFGQLQEGLAAST